MSLNKGCQKYFINPGQGKFIFLIIKQKSVIGTGRYRGRLLRRIIIIVLFCVWVITWLTSSSDEVGRLVVMPANSGTETIVIICRAVYVWKLLDAVLSRCQVIAAISLVLDQALHHELVRSLWNSSALRHVLVTQVNLLHILSMVNIALKMS